VSQVDGALLRYVSARAGLTFEGSRGDILRHAVARAAELQGVDTEQLLLRVSSDHRAFAELCDHVTVRETFFFRERSKLELLRHSLLDRSFGDPSPVRIWSAGCASGEEVYTVAAVVADAGLRGRAHIIGTDLSSAAISSSRAGSYGRWAIRGLDKATTARLFTEQAGRYQVRDELRSGVEFHQHNVLDPLPKHVGRFDIIFCRNLLIYFTPDAVELAVNRLLDALVPGGLLVTGAADPMLDRLHGLSAVVTKHGLAYRRHDGSRSSGTTPPSVVDGVPRKRLPAGPVPRSLRHRGGLPSRETAGPASALRLVAEGDLALQQARPRAAEAAARQLLQMSASSAAAHRILVEALAQDGQLTESIAAAHTAVALNRTDPELHCLYAAVLLQAGNAAAAQRAAHRAVYLDPELVHGYAVLSRAHELLGEHSQARRARRNIRRLLGSQRESA
jgi:chemotaxis protein methyltransferase CheR